MKSLGLSLVLCLLFLTGTIGYAVDDPAPARHVIYLHGWIVQNQQDPRPRHPEFGFYELEEILAVFSEQGFKVSGEIRPRAATMDESADHVVAQIEGLIESGVPGSYVTVVGASMGAGIALLASERLGNPDVRFAVLGTCIVTSFNRIVEQEGNGPQGHILAIREVQDRVTSPCPALAAASNGHFPDDMREIVVDTGLDHGFLYRPIPQWIDPVLKWVMAGE